MQDYMDLDTNEKVRYMSESSNASTSGYSTMSPGGTQQSGSGVSPSTSVYSSPAPSPRTAALPAELSNLHLPTMAQQQQQQYQQYNQVLYTSTGGQTYMNLGSGGGGGSAMPMVQLPQQLGSGSGAGMFGMMSNVFGTHGGGRGDGMPIKSEACNAKLEILEQPVEKFRFRYKSEMHGTHGSLNGANSKRTPKTFPEVKLKDFTGRGKIRCSLFQWNLESPHSHQLVVRKDDTDLCDPHEVDVSPKDGYVATFQNMGIIHTAKKYIFNELLKKKTDRYRFEHGREELSTKQIQQLHKETEKEAKDMDLNKVRLCFEAFQVEDDNTFTRIAGPIYSNPINNRKSAQTGELRICRLSHSSGSVLGGEDLILLVEKVNKKNIKVRFYEMDEDNDLLWEAFAKFRESDVHHQYAIVCQTPHYHNKDIDREVEVCIELVRPTDDERSDPPRQFRYKPRDAVVSRKRRRTCSSLNSFGSGSSNSLSSQELPRTVQEQTANLGMGVLTNVVGVGGGGAMTIGSQEFNKSEELKRILDSESFKHMINTNSEELSSMCMTDMNLDLVGTLETDGVALTAIKERKKLNALASAGINSHLIQIIRIAEEAARAKPGSPALNAVAKSIADIYIDYSEKNENNDSLLHEIIANDNAKVAMRLYNILQHYRLQELLNRSLNMQNESALHCACINDRPAYIRPLLGLDCDPNIVDRRGNTALHVAVREQHRQCIDSFLNVMGSGGGGVRLNLKIKNDQGLTPLHLAIRQKWDDVAEKLIRYDASAAHVANVKDGNTALHMAVQLRNLPLVKAILSRSTLPISETLLNSRNAAGLSVVDMAQQLPDNSAMLDYLRPLINEMDLSNVIKEEEMSSSSFSDEEEEASIEPLALEVRNKIIKTEDMEDGNSDVEPPALISADVSAAIQPPKELFQILANPKQFRELVARLNEQKRWITLAKHLKIQHLIVLWSNAEDMLRHISEHASIMRPDDFTKALALVLDGGERQVAKILGSN